MTYLDFPRLHFAGSFFSDPSTVNNHPAHYENDNFDRSKHWKRGEPSAPGGSPDHGWWNPEGRHTFRFESVRITSAMRADASPATATDPIFVHQLVTRGRSSGKMVDLDPDQQLASMIFGVNLALVDSAGRVAVEGALEPVPFTDIWRRGVPGGGDEAASAAYQSIIAVSSWGDVSTSVFLQQLREAASDGVLSIKFNLDGYSMSPTNAGGAANPRFARGRVVGTVGPAASPEPKHFVLGRQFGDEVHPPGGANPAFRPVSGVNYFPGVFDAKGGKIRLDLGNALPVSPAGGPPQDIGDLRLGCRRDDGSVTEIASIDYRRAGWYEDTAGIAEIPQDRMLTETEDQLVKTAPLCLVVHREGQRRIASEEANAHVRADAFVARLDPGDRFVVRFRASRLGQPASNARINMFLLFPGNPVAQENFPVSGLTFPAFVDCDADGVAEATMVASDPGDPRFFYSGRLREHVDGQVYRVGYELDGHVQHNPSNILSILVWNTFVPDEPPTWHGSMQKVLAQYGNLYPWMTNFGPRLDLADYEQIVEQRERMLDVIRLPITDPRYMPVTRDLSRSRRDAMLRWLTELGADGKPLLGVEPASDAVEAGAQPEEEPAFNEDVDLELGSKTLAGRRNTIVRL